MKVLVDTCIWSQALRRKSEETAQIEVTRLMELIEEQRIEIIGPIRQELLTGIRTKQEFVLLQEKLRAFVDLEIVTKNYERAAEMSNICRKVGIQGSHIDFLICAMSEAHHLSIFTDDRDFSLYARHLPILLF